MSTSTTPPAVGSGLQNNTTTRSTEDGVDSWVNTTEPRITFLSLFIICGFLGNLCIIVTICHSRRFRNRAFYVFITNLAIVNICECVLNMAVVLSTSIKNEWSYGNMACNMNAFFINFIAIETILSLTIITSDRMVAVRYRGRYAHVVSTPRFYILIIYSWCQSFGFSMPIALGVVNPSVYKNLYYCTLHTGTSVVYSACTAFFCYIMPIVISVSFYIYIVRTGYKERFVVRALLAQQNYNEDSHEEPKIRREIRYSKLSGTLFAAWVLLEGPYILTEYFRQFQNSTELEGSTDESLEYAWHVDVVLLWIRFGYIVVLPVAAFLWSKELWKSFKDLILCRKNNAIVDASSKKCEIEASPFEKNLQDEEKVRQVFAPTKEQRVFQVPVLFATSHGVHIKTSSDTDVSDSEESSGKIRGKKCDVVGSRDNLNAVEDDTSDYDSGNEPDPFSMSHPISVKQLDNANELTVQKRSASQPEVRDKGDSRPSAVNNTVGSTSAGDSGLDLSSGNTYSRVFTPLETSVRTTVGKTDANDSGVVGEEKTCSTETDIPQSHLRIGEVNVNEHDDSVTSDNKSDIQPNTFNQKSKCSPTKETKVSRIGETDDSEIKPDNLLYKTDSVSTVICKAEICSDVSTKQNGTELNEDDTPRNNLEISDSPVPRRKKKKRREKLDECRSNASTSRTNSPMLPPRPPPRLSPISNTINKLLHSNSMRPGSSCSSLCSMLDSSPGTIHYPYSHLDTHSASSVDAANDSDTATCDITHVPYSDTATCDIAHGPYSDTATCDITHVPYSDTATCDIAHGPYSDTATCDITHVPYSNEEHESTHNSSDADEHVNNSDVTPCITDAADNQMKAAADIKHRPLTLDLKRQIGIVHEDIVSPSDCHMTDVLHNQTESKATCGTGKGECDATDTDVTVVTTGVINQGYISSGEEGSTESHGDAAAVTSRPDELHKDATGCSENCNLLCQ